MELFHTDTDYSTDRNFGGVHFGPDRTDVGVSLSINLKLIGREIIFEVFQPMLSRYPNVTD